MSQPTAYCMKCKEKREMKDVEPVVMKNGKPAKRGVCSKCGTKMFKIGAGPLVTGGAYKKAKKAKSKRTTKPKSKKNTKRKSKRSKKTKTKSKRM